MGYLSTYAVDSTINFMKVVTTEKDQYMFTESLVNSKVDYTPRYCRTESFFKQEITRS